MAKKIVVPTLDVAVETVETVDSTTQEDTTMITETVDAVETVEIPVLSDVLDRMESAIDAAMEIKPMPKLPVDESATLDVTLAELIAYTPDAIKGAIDEIKANHNVVNVLIGKMPETVIDATRLALGITANFDADVDAVKARLGGKVASVIDAIKRDEKWDTVVEYREMLRLINVVNDARSKLGLPGLLVKVGGRIKGASASQDATVHTKNTTGFMRPGILEGKGVDDARVQWLVTNDTITVNVDGVKVYQGAQGAISLSEIHNDYVRPACNANGRESFPRWLFDNGFQDSSVIMLRAKPDFPVNA